MVSLGSGDDRGVGGKREVNTGEARQRKPDQYFACLKFDGPFG